ncbi:unnamed protein product, partial [marine sediment metagenome]
TCVGWLTSKVLVTACAGSLPSENKPAIAASNTIASQRIPFILLSPFTF